MLIHVKLPNAANYIKRETKHTKERNKKEEKTSLFDLYREH